jgi:hypothetical protein
MKDVLGYLLMFAFVIGFVVVKVRNRPGNVATRRHDRYERKFNKAKTPDDQLRHACAYLSEVADAYNATGKVAKDVFAMAAKCNTAPVAKQVVTVNPPTTN